MRQFLNGTVMLYKLDWQHPNSFFSPCHSIDGVDHLIRLLTRTISFLVAIPDSLASPSSSFFFLVCIVIKHPLYLHMERREAIPKKKRGTTEIWTLDLLIQCIAPQTARVHWIPSNSQFKKVLFHPNMSNLTFGQSSVKTLYNEWMNKNVISLK